MDKLLLEIYQTAGWTGVILSIVGTLLIPFATIIGLWIRTYINKKNAEINALNAETERSKAETQVITVTAKLASESSDDLRVQREAYKALRDEKDRVDKELVKAYEAIEASDVESRQANKALADCRASNKQLIDQLRAYGE